jgi:catechol 2,3-dioxygenase-like lactoylglutathione lyase family enzyme
MLLNLSQTGQIALPTTDIERSEAFYSGVLGLRKLYRSATSSSSTALASACCWRR